MTTTELQSSVLRPGLLVALATRVRGGIRYENVEVEQEHAVNETATRAKWETTRYILDRPEYERAQKARSKARGLVVSVCCQSSFGLLCPLGKEAELTEALAAAQKIANDHNESAKFTRLEVYVITGKVSDNDLEATRAISAEVRDLLDAMSEGIKAADPVAIRDAANRARAVSGMLSEDVQQRVGKAIEEVRGVARELAKAAKAGETAASVTQDLKLERLAAARFAVLDMGSCAAQAPSEGVAAPAAPAIDLLPVDDESDALPEGLEAAPLPSFDFDSAASGGIPIPAPAATPSIEL